MVSEEPDPFLQFVFLPLGETIKGRHGQAEDSVELLWWEVTLGKQGRWKPLRREKSKTAGWGNEKCDKPTKSALPFWLFNKALEEPLYIRPIFLSPLINVVFYRMIMDLVHTETCSYSPPVWLGPHRLEDAAAPLLIPPGLHKGRSDRHRFTGATLLEHIDIHSI